MSTSTADEPRRPTFEERSRALPRVLAAHHVVGLLPQARIAPAWAVCMATRNGINGIARQWPVQLEALGGLAGNLARFCSDRV